MRRVAVAGALVVVVWMLWAFAADLVEDVSPVQQAALPNLASPHAVAIEAPAITRELATNGVPVGAVMVGRLCVLVRGLSSRPAQGVAVVVRAVSPVADNGRTKPPQYHSFTDADGSATFDVPAGAVGIIVQGRVLQSAEVLPAASTTVEVHLPAVFEGIVKVVDARGSGVPHASVVCGAWDGAFADGILARTDSEGVCRVPCVRSKVLVRAFKDGFVTSPSAEMSRRQARVELQLGDGPAAIAGVVRDSDGSLQSSGGVILVPHGMRPLRDVPMFAELNEGRYSLLGVPAGPIRLIAWRPMAGSRRHFTEARATVTANGYAQVDLQFGKGARILAELADDNGAPLAGIGVSMQWHDAPWVGLLSHGGVSVKTDDSGVAVIDSIMPGKYRIHVSLPWGELDEIVELAEGQDLRLAPSRDSRSGSRTWLEVVLVDSLGQPMPRWSVELLRAGGRPKTAGTDVSGSARFDDVASGLHSIAVKGPDAAFASVLREVSAGEATRIVVASAMLPTGSVRGSFVVSEGSAPDTLRLELTAALDKTRRRIAIALPSGAFEQGGLPPGAYELSWVSSQPGVASGRQEFRVGVQEAVDLGSISTTSSGVLRLELRAEAGALLEGAFVGLTRGNETDAFVRVPIDFDGHTLTLSPPRDRRLLVWGAEIAPSVVDVKTFKGEDSVVAVEVSRATRTTFLVRDQSSGATEQTVTITSGGKQVVRERMGGGGSFIRGLKPGNYRVDVVSGTGKSGSADFTVMSDTGAPVEVRLQ